MIVTFEDYLVRDFPTKENGNKAVGVPVWIFVTGSDQLASLYDKDNRPIGNPVITDSRGNYSFKVEEGFYDFKVDVNTDSESFLYEDKVIFGESVFVDAFEAYEVPPFNGSQFTLPRAAENIFVTINGRGLAPSSVTIADDDVTVSLIGYEVTTSDEVVARVIFADVLPGVDYGGIVDNRVTDVNADISPVIKEIYNEGFRILYIYGDYYIDRAEFDTAYNDIHILSYGKLTIHPDTEANPSGIIADNILWSFSGENQKLTNIYIDVNDVRGITGLDFNGAVNPKINLPTVCNGGTSAILPKYCSAISYRGVKGGYTRGAKTFNYLNADLTGSDSRGITLDGSIANPSEGHIFYDCDFEDNTSCMIAGYAKDCHFIGGTQTRNNQTNISSTKNGFYFVAYDADYQGGGCSVSGYTFTRVQQPFVTRVSDVTWSDSVCVDCNIDLGFDNSATPLVPIKDVVVDNIKVRMTNSASQLSGGFLRTRANHALAENCTIKNCDVITNAIYGGFLYCDIDNGRLDGFLFENCTFMFMLKDPLVQTNLRVGVFVEGTNNRIKDCTFKALNRTGGALSEPLTMEIVLPEEGGNDWIDNELVSDDPDLYIRAFNVFNGDSHVQDNVNVLLGDIGNGVLQSKKFGSTAGRTVAAISGIFPRSGAWNSGDLIKRDAIVTQPVNYFPSNSDEYWLCIKSGDYNDASTANWPIWCANGDYNKQRVAILPPTLLQPSNATKGVDVLVQIDPTINMYPTVNIKSVLYELYEFVSGSLNLIEQRASSNDRELFTGLTDGSKYRVNVIGRSAFFIDQGVPVGYDFTVDAGEPSDTLGTPVNITTNDPILESHFDARVQDTRLVEVDDYTIQVLDYADNDLDKTLFLNSLTGGTLRLSNDAGSGSRLRGINNSGTWTIVPSSGTAYVGPSEIPQAFGFDILRMASTWYVQIYPLDYTEPVSGTFNDGDANTVSVTLGKITNFGV